jgi:transcription-repair coupling factor (superfamily II helicase)
MLTLTATPIPRTLQMSLLDIRDLSVIATPPEHRRKILTFVARHDDLVIKEAVVRELQRGGQVFLIHNRVRTIHEKARLVQKLVPGARVGVAHGQMAPKDLEEVMAGFVNRELDVLVCTTIVESGLDISSANTIIILRADRLGMAEIYQLRGRVGRGSEQSYAYLLVPSLDGLTKEARDRLRALMEYSDLGGGFKLAMSDLQIRGGGNLLGISQSGQIAAVGYDLYLELLQQTVADLKRRELLGEAVAELPEPEINLAMAAFIPESYIVDVDQRYIAYRRLAGAASGEELHDLREELADRYGTLPGETENLCDILELKIDLRRLGVARMDQGPESLAFAFAEQTPVPPEAIIALAGNSGGRMRFTPDGRLILRLSRQERRDSRAVLRTAGDILQALGQWQGR